MRANLTAPALATWLCVGGIICIVWHVPWYVGALGGLAAAALAYWLLVWMEPKWRLIPEWNWDALQALGYTALSVTWPSSESMIVLKVMYGLLAALTAARCIRSFLRRDEPPRLG